MGRPAKPTNLKLLQGTARKSTLIQGEPDPAYVLSAEGSMPAWLPDSAKAVWLEIAPALIRAHLLTEVDVPMLAKGCVAEANYRAITLLIRDEFVKARPLLMPGSGEPVLDDDDRAVMVGEHISQKVIAQSMFINQADRIFGQFGMTPRARTGISIQPQQDLFGGNNPAAKYF